MKQPVIGIVGGGQLGRMLTQAAIPLGFSVVVVDPNENCPAAQVGAKQIKADLYDSDALHELANEADFITVEIEHLETKTLKKIAESGIPVNPHPDTITLIQDKYQQKEFLQEHGLPVAPFQRVNSERDVRDFMEQYDQKVFLKTRHGAFDGRGNAAIASPEDLKEALHHFKDKQLYVEATVPFRQELAVLVAKDMNGNIQTYPVTETFHERSICIQTITPARFSKSIQSEATKLATKAISELGGAGLFAVELFLLDDGSLMINEIAPRVHNSGHFTIDASETSQFEQHIRAISNLPLGSTKLTAPYAVMRNILGKRDGEAQLDGIHAALALDHVNLHFYGKLMTKFDRKMGHITATGDTIKQTLERALRAEQSISI